MFKSLGSSRLQYKSSPWLPLCLYSNNTPIRYVNMSMPCGRLQNSRLDTRCVSNINKADSGRAFQKAFTEISHTFGMKKSYYTAEWTVTNRDALLMEHFCLWQPLYHDRHLQDLSAPWNLYSEKKYAVSFFHLEYKGKQNQEGGSCYLNSKMISQKMFQLQGNNSTILKFFINLDPYPS